jgi:hypothetical protein
MGPRFGLKGGSLDKVQRLGLNVVMVRRFGLKGASHSWNRSLGLDVVLIHKKGCIHVIWHSFRFMTKACGSENKFPKGMTHSYLYRIARGLIQTFFLSYNWSDLLCFNTTVMYA